MNSSDADLLAGLLATKLDTPASAPSPAPSSARRSWLRYLLFAVAAVAALWLGLIAGRLAYAAYTIRENVAAMQLQPTPLLQAGLLAPSATTAPTAQPDPTVVPDTTVASIGSGPTQSIPGDPTSFVVVPAYQPSATPIRLPALGAAPLPTLMATAPVILPSGSAVNILLLGSDRRPGESWASRSDAVMVARLEPDRGRVALLSLPRDLIVSIPGYGQARLNSVTVYGEQNPALGGGAELARRTVSQLLGLPIHHVLRADFDAFTTAIDAIGGVEITVEEELYDPLYPTMDYGYTEVYFAPGVQLMDGATALVYARIRHGDSNYARNRRQQQVLLAALERVRGQNPLGQVELISDLTTALRDDIQTDMSLEELVGLAWAFRNIAPEQVEQFALDENMVREGVLADDPYATFALPGALESLTREFLRGSGGR